MASQNKVDYFYIEPDCLIKHSYAGKEFFIEQVNNYILTLKCMKRSICCFAEKYEMDNLQHCLLKLRSGIAALNIGPLNKVIDALIAGAEMLQPKEVFEENFREFLLICDLLESDLICIKQKEELSG